jgi:hypothetical protein
MRPELMALRWAIKARYQMLDIWKHPMRLWHWSAKWPWYTGLFLGALAVIAASEYALSIFLLFLSALGILSKVIHWNGDTTLKGIGTVGVLLLLTAFTYIIVAEKGEKDWSHLERPIVLLTTRSPSAPTPPQRKPLEISFASTIIPIPSGQHQLTAPPKAPLEGTNITIDVGPTLNREHPSETQFILTNRNPSSITDAKYICESHDDAENIGQILHAIGGGIGDLPSGDQHSFSCDAPDSYARLESMKWPIYEIVILYKYKTDTKNKGFRFTARRDSAGMFVWLPQGPAKVLVLRTK